METASDGVWLIDCEGQTTFTNRRMTDLLGLLPGSLIGADPHPYLIEDDIAVADRVVSATLCGEAQQFDVRFRRTDGAEVPCTGNSAPIRNGQDEIVGAMATFTDISARMRAETALATQVAELEALYKSAPIGLAFFTRDYRYLRINQELATINGVPAEDHIGRTLREVLPVNAPVVEPLIDRIFETGEAIRDLEISGETPQQPGIDRHWLTGFYPVQGEDGAVEAVGAWVIEISDRKAAEQREQLLAREVDHRAKNLLTVVQSVLQLTRADSVEELKESVIGRIQSLARAHALLANSRWEGVELTELVREEMAPFTGDKRRQLTISGPPLMLRPAAAQSLALVLHELATNAVKYGALSTIDGAVEIKWAVAGEPSLLTLDWIESAARPVAPPSNVGFGSRIIAASVERQLQGKVTQDWNPGGLRCRLQFHLRSAMPLSDV